MWRYFLAEVSAFALIIGMLCNSPAAGMGLDPAFKQDLLGPERAMGVLVWSHGRSITVEDSESATPPFLRVLRDGGWDVLRFDRPRDGDTLTESTRRLLDYVAQLKHKGYHRIVLAGQSFGAFLALMAADASDDVDAVVATAPAAFGSFDEFYGSWRLNAIRLYPLLEQVRRARIMLFYFHGDDFDPGGRGEQSRAILSEHGHGYAVVDQPAFLVGHWASSTGLFLRRFGGCIHDFIDDDALKGELVCQPVWGEVPSAELRLPDELFHPRATTPLAAPAIGASPPSALGAPALGRGRAVHGTWYGFYPNGRELLVAIDRMPGQELAAVYAIGPGIDEDEPAEWTRREGRIDDDDFVFEEQGKSKLRFHPRGNGGLKATWISPDGKTSMEASLRRIEPRQFFSRAEAR
jgi:pimeloyl-ACP methyl ester carboxylesterase